MTGGRGASGGVCLRVFLDPAIDLLCVQGVCNFMWNLCHFKGTCSIQCGVECSETKLSGHSLLTSAAHAYIMIKKKNPEAGIWKKYPLRY